MTVDTVTGYTFGAHCNTVSHMYCVNFVCIRILNILHRHVWGMAIVHIVHCKYCAYLCSIDIKSLDTVCRIRTTYIVSFCTYIHKKMPHMYYNFTGKHLLRSLVLYTAGGGGTFY